ncbi:MAG: hypothetical protein IJB11_07680, partial [Oscillospiraceae bacterium]|nr:hypothetical protein [Oscillospiraceae bacterium]
VVRALPEPEGEWRYLKCSSKSKKTQNSIGFCPYSPSDTAFGGASFPSGEAMRLRHWCAKR